MSVESSSKAILALACKRIEELVINIEGSKIGHRSSFVGMPDKTGAFFYIDALPQGADRRHLTPDKSLLSGKFDMHDVRYKFKAIYAGLVKYGGFNSLRLKVPDKISVLQRREHFRVEPKISNPIKIYLPDGEETTAIDVSTGGASFWCKRPYPEGAIVNMRIDLPGETEILKLDLNVIASDKVKDSYTARKRSIAPYKVRGKFQNPLPKDIQTIQHFGHARQREVIRITGD